MHVFSLFTWQAFSKQHEKQTRAKLYDPFIQFKKTHGNTQRIRNASDFELDKKNILVYLTRVKVPCFI